MAEDWYSTQPQTRFAREHRQQLPSDAHMIDCDGTIWIPYSPGTGLPLMVVELKPENPKQEGWYVVRALAELAGIPAVLITELDNGLYRIQVATEANRYQPYQLPDDLTIQGWYERVEKPLRDRQAEQMQKNIFELLG